MRQLSPLDYQFLAAERRGVLAHVSWLCVYASDLTPERLRSRISGKLGELEPLRWRLARVPLALDWPYWETVRPDLSYHFKELTVSSPGDDNALQTLLGEIIRRPLDRRRPLWRIYLIHGLSDGRCAVLFKVHHALVDGVSQVDLIGAIHDAPIHDAPLNGRKVDTAFAEDLATIPVRVGWALRGLFRYWARLVGSARRALPYLDQVPTLRLLPGVPPLSDWIRRRAGRPRGPEWSRRIHVPPTTLNGRLSPDRSVAWTSVPFDQVRALADRGATINDVVVGTCAGALSEWLVETIQLADDDLVAMILKSRRQESTAKFGNALSAFLARIPTGAMTEVARLRATHSRLAVAKQQHACLPPTILADANNLIPPPLFRAAARLTTRIASNQRREPPLSLVLSNIQGPREPWCMHGVRLEELYPLSALMPGAGLNITVVSYAGKINYGVVSDPTKLRDPWPLAAGLVRAHNELVRSQ